MGGLHKRLWEDIIGDMLSPIVRHGLARRMGGGMLYKHTHTLQDYYTQLTASSAFT